MNMILWDDDRRWNTKENWNEVYVFEERTPLSLNTTQHNTTRHKVGFTFDEFLENISFHSLRFLILRYKARRALKTKDRKFGERFEYRRDLVIGVSVGLFKLQNLNNTVYSNTETE